MNSVVNGENVETEVETPRRRRRRKPGRPKGSGRKAREAEAAEIALGKSKAAYRKWQRSHVKPQFTLSRGDANDLLLKFLRSRQGRGALKAIIKDGFKGIDKLADDKLARYLEESNLLSRYPHEVLVTS